MKILEDDDLIKLTLTFVAIWCIALLLAVFAYAHGPEELQKLGQFGDSFNFLSSLFSSLALAFTAYAIVFQARSREKEDQIASIERKDRLAAIEEQRIERLLVMLVRIRRDSSAMITRNFSKIVADNSLDQFRMHDHVVLTASYVKLHYPSEAYRMVEIGSAVEELNLAVQLLSQEKQKAKQKMSSKVDMMKNQSVKTMMHLQKLTRELSDKLISDYRETMPKC